MDDDLDSDSQYHLGAFPPCSCLSLLIPCEILEGECYNPTLRLKTQDLADQLTEFHLFRVQLEFRVQVLSPQMSIHYWPQAQVLQSTVDGEKHTKDRDTERKHIFVIWLFLFCCCLFVYEIVCMYGWWPFANQSSEPSDSKATWQPSSEAGCLLPGQPRGGLRCTQLVQVARSQFPVPTDWEQTVDTEPYVTVRTPTREVAVPCSDLPGGCGVLVLDALCRKDRL